MNMELKRKLPTAQEIRAMYPISPAAAAKKAENDREIREVFLGNSDKLILVIGPCSADREDAVLEYISRLQTVQEKVSEKIILIPRIYTNKPRTTGDGYKGMLHQPDPKSSPNLLKGLLSIRRGSVDRHGNMQANYHYEDLQTLAELYAQSGLQNPGVIVDTNHCNSGKRFDEQPRIAKEILHSTRHNPDIYRLVKGLMVESYLEDGAQKPEGGEYGKSITDPCLGWEKTERLILELAELRA